MSGSGDYIRRADAIEAMYKDAEAHQDHTFWTTQHEALLNIPAADAIEELSAYAMQLEDLRKDGYYLQKTKMMTYGQATVTMPLPEPPKEGET